MEQEKAYSLQSFLKYILKRWFVVLISFLIFLVGGILYGSFIMKPTYTSTISVMMRMKVEDGSSVLDSNKTSNEAILSTMYFPTVTAQIKSPECVSLAKSKLPADNNDIFSGSISMEYGENTLVFSLSYSAKIKNTENPYEYTDARISAVIEAAREFVPEYVPSEGVVFIPLQKTPTHKSQNELSTVIVIASLLGIALPIIILALIRQIQNEKEELLIKKQTEKLLIK